MNRHDDGYSIIEMLSVMALSIILIASLMGLFFQIVQAHHLIQNFSEVQENMRFAAFYLRKQIQEAGFIGCRKLSPNFLIENKGVSAFNELNYNNAIQVYEGVNGQWIPSLPSGVKLSPKKNTDVVLARGILGYTATVTSLIDNTDRITIKGEVDLKADDEIVLADCQRAVLLRVKSIRLLTDQVQELTVTEKISGSFEAGAEVGRLTTRIYFIQTTARQSPLGEKIEALYEMREDGTKSELVGGITDLKVMSYLDSDTHALLVSSPHQVSFWENVRAIRLDFLFSSQYAEAKRLKSLSINRKFSIYIPLVERIS